MKRCLPLLLALLLLLTACGTAVEEGGETLPMVEETGPEEYAEPDEVQDEDELPIMPAGGETTEPAAAAGGEEVTLDGLSSYLRVTLPEGWTWEQAGGTADGVLYGLRPADDPDFVVELHYWPDGFGMCGTGVTFSEYTLPDGGKATLAYELIGETMSWTLILPELPDSFTIQFNAPMSLYEAHRAELEQMLGTIRQGVLAGLDVVRPVEDATK